MAKPKVHYGTGGWNGAADIDFNYLVKYNESMLEQSSALYCINE